MITSSSWRTPYSKLWSMGDFFTEKYKFKDEEYLEFSKVTEDKLIGTQMDGVATVYDVETGQQVRMLKPTISNNYSRWDNRMAIGHPDNNMNHQESGLFRPYRRANPVRRCSVGLSSQQTDSQV